MPVHKVKGGYKWGSHGHVYPTRAGAEKQAKAIYANGYKGDASEEEISERIKREIDRGHSPKQAEAIAYSELGEPKHDEETTLAPMLEEMTRDGELFMPLREDSEESEPRTELDAARLMAEGRLSSPQVFGNVWLFDVRVTGTDTAYREALNEYVYRPPEYYLNDEFLARCNGLPVVVEHPEGQALDTEEFRKRIIGTIFLPYIKGDEVWGIAKIFDEAGAEMMLTTHGSTSPAVVFRRLDGNKKIEMDDGSHVLIEGVPSLLDHLAICAEGVWDKGNGPSGININRGDSEMPETDKEVLEKGIEETSEGKARRDRKDRKDESEIPAWADALMKKVDSLHEKHDSISRRLDCVEEDSRRDRKDESEEEREDRRDRKDESAEEREEHEAEGGRKANAELRGERKEKERLEREDRKDRKDRKDESFSEWAEEEKEEPEHKEDRKDHEREERKDFDRERSDSRMDSVSRELAEFRAWKKSVSRPLSFAEKDQLAEIQARFDSLASRFGETIQPPLLGETPTSYHRRLISRFQKHSERCKNVKLDSLDAQSFPIIADQIYADAQSAASNAMQNISGGLRAETFTDFAGRKCTRYFGDIKTAFAPWIQKTLKVKINTALTSKK